MKEFYNLYYKKVFVNKKPEYLTEIQNRQTGGPILIDFDFRYDQTVTERLHNDSTISDLIDLYSENIFKMLDISNYDNIEFNIYVFQKDDINILPNVVKDGIHMIIGIHMDHKEQQILRNQLLKKSSETQNKATIMYECLDDLNLINSAEEILDEGISKGQTGWQLFGSRKPGCEAYKLTNIYKITYTKPDNSDYSDGIDIIETELPKNNEIKELLPIISAQNKNLTRYPLKQSFQEIYEKFSTKKKRKN